MNQNVPILAEYFRRSHTLVEQSWHTAKSLVRTDGEKRNYLLAWHSVFEIMGDLVRRPVFKLGDDILIWNCRGKITECDATFVTIVLQERSWPSVIPVALLYLYGKTLS